MGVVLLGLSFLNYRFVMSQDFPYFMSHWWAFPVAMVETFAIISVPILFMLVMGLGRVAVFGRELESRLDKLTLLASAAPFGVREARR